MSADHDAPSPDAPKPQQSRAAAEHSGSRAGGEAAGEPLAIIGIGAMFPGAADVSEFWDNIRSGVDSIREVPETHWSPEDYFDDDPRRSDFTYGRRGGFLEPYDFDPREFGISPADIASTDTTQLLGMVVAKAALEDAGYGEGGRELDRARTSVVLGVTGALELVIPLGARLGHPRWKRALDAAGVDPVTRDQVLEHIADSYVPWTESSFPGLLGNVAAGRIASKLDLHGTNCVVDAACASSMSALHLAALELETGRADMVLAGGLDTFNDIFMFMCFSKTPALSPSGDARPFDREGDGTILGEGLGVLAVRRLRDALADGDQIYAVVRGIGTASDGKGVAVYEPSAIGQARALRQAYRRAGVDPTTIELVEAHGTGTRVGDATEVRALSEVYREAQEDGQWCAIGSVKSNVGHTKAAAGAAGLIKAVLALHHKVLPPTIKVSQPNEALRSSPFYANAAARPWARSSAHLRRAAVSAFGFGGTNFHCVLEEAPEESRRPESTGAGDWSGRVQILALSADSRSDLALQVKAARQHAGEASTWRRHAGASRRSFDAQAAQRLCLVTSAGEVKEASRMLDLAENLLQRSEATVVDPRGIVLSSAPPIADIGVLFPGQGAQEVGMLRDMACRFAEFGEELRAADADFVAATGQSLVDHIYPRELFTAEQRADAELALRSTELAQPALGAVSLGAWRILQRFSVPVRLAIGHSFGELVALTASGRLEARDLHRLARRRGSLMAQGTDDRGAMLAIFASAREVESLISSEGLACRIANYNSPQQVVISGASEDIGRAAALCAAADLRCRRLRVAAAFHSRFVAGAVAPFADEVERTPWHAASFEVLANSTGEAYPEHAGAQRLLLTQQLAEPVLFQQCIENAKRRGVSLFVEVGPGRQLSGLVDQIAAGSGDASALRAVPMGAADGERAVARVLSELAARGVAFELQRWDPHLEAAPAPRFTVRISGANAGSARARTNAEISGTAPTAGQSDGLLASAEGAEAEILDSARWLAGREETRPAEAAEVAAFPGASRSDEMVASEAVPQPHESPARKQDHTPTGSTREKENAPAGQVAPSSTEAPSDAPAAADAPPAEVTSAPASMTAAAVKVAAPARTASQREGGSDWLNRGIDALLEIQEQTAHAHQRFLDSQEAAAQRLERLLAASTRFVQIEGARQPAVPMLPNATHEASAEDLVSAAPESALAATHEEAAPRSAPAAPQRTQELHPEGEAEAADDEHAPLGVAASAAATPASDQGSVSQTPDATPSIAGENSDFAESARGQEPEIPSGPDQRASAPAQPEMVQAAEKGFTAIVLEVVAERTGYPLEMLDVGMELDADLGIDSIKRVEILSALQERLPDAPVPEPEELAALRTLAEVIGSLGAAPAAGAEGPEDAEGPEGVLPASAAAVPNGALLPAEDCVEDAVAVAARTSSREADPASDHRDAGVEQVLLEVVAERTGYPAEMLSLDMELDGDLGIDSIKRVEILSALQERLPALPVPEPEQLAELQTLGAVAHFLMQGDAAAQAVGHGREETTVQDAAGGAADEAGGAPQEEEGGAQSTLEVPQEASSAALASSGAAAASSAMPVLLEVVAERTGYPAEMLSGDMELDGDLGIDSIKRVEILSALQDRFPAVEMPEPEQLAQLQTLAAVAEALERRLEPSAGAQRGNAAPAASRGESLASEASSAPVSELAVEEQLEPQEGEHETQAASSPPSEPPSESPAEAQHQQAATEELENEPLPAREFDRAEELQEEDAQEFNEETEEPELAVAAPPEATTQGGLDRYVLRLEPLGSTEEEPLLERGARIWVVGPDEVFATRLTQELAQRGYLAEAVESHSPRPIPADLNGLVLLGPRGVEGAAGDRFVRDSFRWMQRAAGALRALGGAGKGALLAGIVRLDGGFGLAGEAALTGVEEAGVAGLIKTARWEWSEVSCRVVDWSPELSDDAGEIVGLVDELLRQGPLEIGLGPQGRVTPALRPQSIKGENAEADGTRELSSDDLIVVTGGARGVTAEVALAMAQEWHPRMVVLGRTPLDGEESEALRGLDDPTEIRRFLAGEKPGSLREIEMRYQRVLAAREGRHNLERMREAGSLVTYRAVDLRDAQALQEAVLEIVGALGPVTGVVHGAGVLADRSIEDKEPEDFQRVYDTKVVGLRNLLSSLQGHPVGLIALFSSTTARFGRRGQCDYAAANEVLNKIAQREARQRDGCRVLALGWGPWDGGMVDEGLKRVFEQERVEVIGRERGGRAFISELEANSHDPEVVLLGSGSSLPESAIVQRVDPEARAGSSGIGVGTLCLERTLRLEDHRFLAAHVLDGYPVLPAAVMMDWMAHAALHGQPGRLFHSLLDFRVFKGVRLYEASCSLRVLSGESQATAGGVFVPVEIRSGSADSVLHAAGRVLVMDELSAVQGSPERIAGEPYPFEARDYYEKFLFHGQLFHAVEEVEICGSKGILGRVRQAPAPSEWMANPVRGRWLIDPLMVDGAFQLMILWSQRMRQAPSLPAHLELFEQFAGAPPSGLVDVQCEVVDEGPNRARADIDFFAGDQLIARMRGYECVIDQSLVVPFRRNRVGDRTSQEQ